MIIPPEKLERQGADRLKSLKDRGYLTAEKLALTKNARLGLGDKPSWEQNCCKGAMVACPLMGKPEVEAQDGKEYQQVRSCSGYGPS